MAVTLTNIPKSIASGQVFAGNPMGLLLTITYPGSETSAFVNAPKNTAPVYTLAKKTPFTDDYELSIAGNTATIPAGTAMGITLAFTYAEDQTYAIAGSNLSLLVSPDFSLTIQPSDDTSSVTNITKS
jgi:hypothetical protein